jgi:TnpA family transposase
MMKKSKRIQILSQAEIDDLYGRPEFTDDEKKWYFELNNNEQELLKLPVSLPTQMDAILQLGYFKVKCQFFKFQFNDVQADVDYIASRHFENATIDKTTIGTEASYLNRQRILDLLGYQLFRKKKHGEPLFAKACELCRLSIDPVFIFRELLDFIFNKKITLPGYTTLQDIISNALSSFQKGINQIVKKQLKRADKQRLLNLLRRQEGLYAVTLLKKQPKNFKPTAIYREIEYYQDYAPLYQVSQDLLPKLGISKKSIFYYAGLVDHYTVQKLDRINQEQTCLWLLCFVYHRCQRMLDNLATMFIYVANQYKNAVEEKAKELLVNDAIDKDSQDACIAKLLRLYVDKNIDGSLPFNAIKEKAYMISPPETIRQLSYHFEKSSKTYQAEFTWKSVDLLASKHKPVLRALLKILPFDGEQHESLLKAVVFLKTVLLAGKPLSKIPYSSFPKQFIRKKIREFFYTDGEKLIHPDRYEYHCYQEIKKYMDAGSFYVNGSLKFKSLSSDLIQQWPKTKPQVLGRLNKPNLSQAFNEFINEKARPLDEKIILLNEAIDAGNNPDVKIKKAKNGTVTWTLPYTKKSTEINNPFYDKLPQVSIAQILTYVNKQAQFIKHFTHIKPHYAKAKLDELATYACLIANGTNLGILKMAEICDLSLTRLNTMDQNYIRVSTLKAANDEICNAIAALPIFRYWNFQADLLHASLDGQKFKTQRETLITRFSKKYFGFGKGVVAYTMVANHVPVNARIIGANEHESRFLFDLVYNNTTEIQPDVFSTDTEGTNQLNFLLLYIIERIFAPRYRSLTSKTESIISFSDPKKFSKYLIKPQNKFNPRLILNEEDNIKHILASLLVGETSQSNVIGKLNSKNFKSKTKRALWEMNAVLMSDYLLDYIGDIILRQSVQGALNRGEAYQQLRRHIALVNGKQMRASTEMEIAVWNECARLLTNSIIYYNATLLTKLMDHFDRLGQKGKSDFIKRLSPVAWTHINFYGQYEFLSEDLLDIDGLLKQVALKDLSIWDDDIYGLN